MYINYYQPDFHPETDKAQVINLILHITWCILNQTEVCLWLK